MKITIFPDYFSAIGGGETVTITMAKILEADIFITEGLFKSLIEIVEIVNC